MRIVSLKFFLIVLFLCDYIHPVYSQKLNPKQYAIISGDLAYYIFNDFSDVSYNMGGRNFAITDKDTFYNPEGFHLLYQLKNGTAKRLDKSSFHGHNFTRFMYTHNDKIYLIGGYGFFTTNNIIESFDPTTKEWNFVASKGERPEFIRGVLFKKDSIVYLFNTFKSGNNAETDYLDSYYYLYNINTNLWSKYKNVNSTFSHLIFLYSYVLKDYVLAFSLTKTLIIDIKDNTYLILPNGDLPVHPNNATFYEIDKNKITYSYVGSILNNLTKINLDIDSLYKSKSSDAIPLVFEVKSEQSLKYMYIYVFSILILSMGFVIGRRKYWQAHKISKELISDKTPNKLVESLLKLTTYMVTVEDLDVIFEIDHMEAESKKSKRHRIISHLDQTHPGLITRVKDETDKRKFVYHIDKQIHM